MQRRGHHLLACSLAALASAAGANETIAYRYDNLGRLIRVDRSGTVNSGVSAQYSYDSADNRTNVTVAGVPTVAGGGFELPEMGTGYAYRPTAGPAAFAGNSGITSNGGAWGFAAAPEGDQVGFLQGGPAAATISLPVTGLTPGASYKISFRISARPGYSSIPLTLSFNAAAIGAFNPPATAFTAATSAAFTAGASSGTLVFSASGSPDQADGIDFVAIAPAGGN
jgi:hypothetical protein